MDSVENKNVLVIGLGSSSAAVCHLLRERNANVTVVHPALETEVIQKLASQGVRFAENETALDLGTFDLAVAGRGFFKNSLLSQSLQQKGIPVISDLELAYQQSYCLNIAVSGTNGKTSTARLIERLLHQCERRTLVAEDNKASACEMIEKTRELDFLTLEASAPQLENTQYFRPSVAVLLNIGHDHVDRFPSHADYIRAKARLFANQQPFDWAIVQSEALAQIQSLNLPMPAKVITFSAHNRRADIFLDRTLLVSRLDGWAGPLVNMEQCRLRGPHYAENLMAALAVGRVLRLPLEQMIKAIRQFEPLPHRCEPVAGPEGISFINDAASKNVQSLRRAIETFSQERRNANIWLIAGGRHKSLEYYDLGPLLSERVKGAFLIGENREKLRAAWGLFTPCALADSLLEAVSQAANNAAPGDVVLFSPACSSLEVLPSELYTGEVFRKAVTDLARTTGCGSDNNKHNMEEIDNRDELTQLSKSSH